MSEEPRSFWGKLALITAFLSALGGVGVMLNQCSGGNNVPSNPDTPPVPPVRNYQTPQAANFCCDVFGNRRCQLVRPVVIGSQCFCPGQGGGISCP
jgi:hypothetical protein